MTGDAQAEAERIVGEYGQLAYEWGCAYTDPERSQGPAQDAWGPQHEALVAALAAAIEYRRAEKRQDRAFARGDADAEGAACDEAADLAVAFDEAIEALGVSSEPDRESA